MIFIEETDTRFYIAPSTLNHAGNGCFAKQPLKKDDWLEVIGVYVKSGGIADFCTEYGKRYKFAGSAKQDAKIVPFGFAGIINHTDDPSLQNCRLEHAKSLNKRSQHAGQTIYRFLRDIEPNEELLGNYGPNMGKEIEVISSNSNFLENYKDDMKQFLQFDLYNLKAVASRLTNL